MDAKLIYHDKVIFSDGDILEIILWQVPQKEGERPHGIKYRLYYGDSKGDCLVRYDNEIGKGDHKHIKNKEYPYLFQNVETLVKDFMRDINNSRYKRGVR